MRALAFITVSLALLAPVAEAARGLDMRNVRGYASCGHCASPQVKAAVRAYVYANAANPSCAVRIIERESGFNPSAISPWGDYGLFQFNYVAHKNWINFSRVTHDVVYAVQLYNRLSRGGTNFAPWRYC